MSDLYLFGPLVRVSEADEFEKLLFFAELSRFRQFSNMPSASEYEGPKRRSKSRFDRLILNKKSLF